MLGKLMKYELKSSGRLLMLLYAAILVVALIGGVMIRGSVVVGKELPLLILFIIYLILVTAMMIITLVVIVGRFFKSLLSQEGYLMHTLPVPTWNHVLCKTLTALIWLVLAAAVLFVSGALFLVGAGATRDMFAALDLESIRNVLSQNGGILILAIAVLIMQLVRIVLQAYVSMAVGATANKHKIFFSFLAFVVIVIILNIITALVAAGSMTHNFSIFAFSGYRTLIYQLIFDGVLSVVFFGGTTLFLKKKLNLE